MQLCTEKMPLYNLGADQRSEIERSNMSIDNLSLAHTCWNCKYHVVFAPKYRRKEFYGLKRLEVGQILRRLCVKVILEMSEIVT